MSAVIDRILAWGPGFEGSTRALGLIRIGLATLVLVRYADEVALFQAVSPLQSLLGMWLFGATLLMLAGFRTRMAVALVSIALVAMYFGGGFVARIAGWNHHHAYLLMIAVVLLNFAPCGASYSVDRYLAVRRARQLGQPPPPEHGPLWAQRLLGLQLSALYFWTAIDKTNLAFLSGDRLEQTLVWIYSNRPLEALFTAPWFLVAGSVAVVALEYFLVVAIHVRRLQPIALPLGIALHLTFYVMLPVATYSATMLILYLAVLDPRTVHRIADSLHGYDARNADPHRL